MMIALFAMIAFVTNLCSPMAVIVQNQFGATELESQIGNYANFIAYLVMGIPSGMLIVKFGYKKTALIALGVGIVGMLLELLSGSMGSYLIYLLGAFVSGFCMCMLNTVVNPLLNVLGGGGNTGNQLIQIGGVFNSAAAVACYILMGSLIADMSKAKISDATPALFIALGIFIVAFIVISMTKIEEPEQAPVRVDLIKGALSFSHFSLGLLAIFFYMGIEVGVPSYVGFYLTEDMKMAEATVGLLVAVYWFMMLIGRFVGASIGSKVSARTMITTVSIATLVLVLFGMFAPKDVLVPFPGVDWSTLTFVTAQVPIGIFALLLVGLCTSVMWGSIFNMAVEGLGKYTAIASGLFMTMVFGCAVMMFVQGLVADATNYLTSFWVVVFCAAYLLYYALVGSRVKKTAND